jgi:hypothetical protein
MPDNYFTSATVWMIVWILIGFVLTIGSSLLTARTLFPAFADRCAARCRTPVRSFFLGLLAAAVAVAAMAFAGKIGKAGPPLAFVIGGAAALLAIAGASGQVLRMAARTAHDGESPDSWAASRRAASILSVSYVLPVAGWLIILPLSLLTGLGCALMSLRARSTGPERSDDTRRPWHPASPALPSPALAKSPAEPPPVTALF